MRTKVIILSVCLLFGGCISQSHKSSPAGYSTKARRASLNDFAGSYENRGVDYPNQNQSTLAGILSLYKQGSEDADTVVLSFTTSGDLEMKAFKAGKELLRSILKKEDGVTLNGGEFHLRAGSRKVDPMFTAGTERWNSYLFITQDGSLGYKYNETFRGVAFIIPAVTKTENIYIFKRKTEPNQSPEPMPMAVTPPAAQASRQP